MDNKIKATEAKMKEEYMQRSKTRRFMHKIGTLVKLGQFKVSKEKKKRLRLYSTQASRYSHDSN